MKDLITITDKFGVARQVELITKFNLNGYDYNYIIYRELDKSHNYIAKYQGEEIVSLDTNISEEELKLAEIVFQGVKE
ncbi:MAG: hypothetical protein Q4F33_02275 [Mycoplasmatota bacterium]|nr:hypothetical protein [Mycoplasmatota bacterium]